jgi:hypothetical protein
MEPRPFRNAISVSSLVLAACYIGQGLIAVAIGLAILGVAATTYRRVLRIPATIAAVVAFLYLPAPIVVILLLGLAVLGPAAYLQINGYG